MNEADYRNPHHSEIKRENQKGDRLTSICNGEVKRRPAAAKTLLSGYRLAPPPLGHRREETIMELKLCVMDIDNA